MIKRIDRLTQRDEYGNADIIALSDTMPEIYAGLSFSETNCLTDVLNKLADYEDKEENRVLFGDVIPIAVIKRAIDSINAADGCDQAGRWDYDDDDMFMYCPCCGARMDGESVRKFQE